MIANRLKPELPQLIIEDQTGFAAGGFIQEKARIVYNTTEHGEIPNKTCFMIILDFAKAFDSIELILFQKCF